MANDHQGMKLKQRQNRDVATWSLPKWDRSGKLIEKPPVIKDEQPEEPAASVEEELHLPTARELQELRDQAWQEGWDEGQQKGHQEGLQKGLAEGRKQGMPEGVEQGREQGIRQGYDQGIHDAQAEMDTLRFTFATLLTQLDEQCQAEQTELDQALVSLIMRLCKNLVLRELSMTPELIQAIVKKAVAALPNPSERIVIEVNPQHMELINELAEQHESNWVVKSNDNLSEGGCMLRTTNSLVDYTLEHRFKQQVEAILTEAELDPAALISILNEQPDYTVDTVEPPAAATSESPEPESNCEENDEIATEFLTPDQGVEQDAADASNPSDPAADDQDLRHES